MNNLKNRYLKENKTFIKNLSRLQLKEYLLGNNFEPFRAKQISDEIFVKRTQSFEEMTLLPVSLRSKLEEDFLLNSLRIKKVKKSKDGSVKFLFELFDERSIEAVFMPWYNDDSDIAERVTLCISSMAGCPVECAFCATGTLGKQRNLETAEIIDQLLLSEKELGQKITNIVFMGMGEPLLNYNNVVDSINIFSDADNKLLSRRKITLSTVGIAAKIKHLADTEKPVKLALSLHATTNGLREKLIPLMGEVAINKIMDAVEYYYRKTKLPVTYEYIMFDGLNDTEEDAKRLAKIAKRIPSKVNIIPYNDISFTNPVGFSAELRPTPMDRINEFAKSVTKSGGKVTVRDTFGEDIEAACGQLALSE
jgi:23S rRNA (adenine2503-C2)-methyltransferase